MPSESLAPQAPKSKMKKDPLVRESDILSDLVEEKASSLFLGRFSMTEVQAVLGRKNFYREAKNRGLLPLALDLDSSEYPVQRLRIFHEEADPDKLIVDLKIREGRVTPKAGLLASPAYFHNALLFSRFFYFLNPEKLAEVLAIEKAFPDIPFKHLAWIVYLNCLRQEDGRVYEWRAEEQVYPINRELKDYFDSKKYKRLGQQSPKGRRSPLD